VRSAGRASARATCASRRVSWAAVAAWTAVALCLLCGAARPASAQASSAALPRKARLGARRHKRHALLRALGTRVASALPEPPRSPVGASPRVTDEFSGRRPGQLYEPATLTGLPLSLSSDPFAGPGLQPLIDAELSEMRRQAELASPAAIATRRRSQTEFEGLDASRATALDRSAFPAILDRSAGGMPSLPNGDRVTGYVSDYAATVAVGGGRDVLLESALPLAVAGPGDRHVPIDLALRPTGAAFAPVASPADISIPSRLDDGVRLARAGVSVTPVDGSGAPLPGGPGDVAGAVVMYANTQTDTDTLIKPTTDGFDAGAILRSQRSPQSLYFHIGLPQGASLAALTAGADGIEVLRGGHAIATISAPSAIDAAGTEVPTTMSVSGQTLTVQVDHRSGSYQYPIEVDPTFTEEQLVTSGARRSNWEFHTDQPATFKGTSAVGPPPILETSASSATYGPGEYGYWGYQTQGDSDIYEVTVATWASNSGAHIESFLELQHGEGEAGVTERKELLSDEAQGTSNYSDKVTTLCPTTANECLPLTGHEHNAVHFQQSAANTCDSCSFSDSIREGLVYLSEPPMHSTTAVNTSSREIEFEAENNGKKERQKRTNAVYGSGSWLSKYQGALEFSAEDAGIGVSATKLEYESAPGQWEQVVEHNYLEREDDCSGVQCYPKHREAWTLNNRLPNGEDHIRYSARDAMPGTESLSSEGTATVKVDASPPRDIVLKGLPYGNEIREAPYQITAEATDGEGTTIASSGIKSIALFVDGREIGKPGGACSVPKGECRGSVTWTINGSELGAGSAALVVVATDNAGNEARHGELLTVLHSRPVALGPGSLNLESGDFSLGAKDVSLGDGLAVTRNYSSRDLTAGESGPLGGQWSMSLGSTESLVELGEGSVELTAANGSQSLFLNLGAEHGYESPPGDSNLTLTAAENSEHTAKIAYYLADAADHTKVKFVQLPGEKTWLPTTDEGPTPTDTVTFDYGLSQPHAEYAVPGASPSAIATGPEGDLWYTTSTHIGKMTTAGEAVEFGLPEGSRPDGIARGAEGDMWFANYGRSTIGRITPSGEITEYPLASGSEPCSIAEGPDGNIWFTDAHSSVNWVSKITPDGTITEYKTADTQEKSCGVAAGPDGNVWFTNPLNDRLGKVTPHGTVTEYPVEATVQDIAAGPGGQIWFTYKGSSGSYVGKMTTSGVVTDYPLPSGVEPGGIASSGGYVWVTEKNTERIARVSAEGAVDEYSLPSESDPSGIAEGPDGNLWYADSGTSRIGVISKPIPEPTEEVAPVPAGVTCAKPPFERGCRALSFRYAEHTTARGDNPTELGEYLGRLARISFEGYNPETKKMESRAVEEYSYDARGRLRAAWDPRISPALKTTYGYDPEGHLTALTPPGQEPWAFTYGTTAADAGSGRLMKLVRGQPAANASRAEEAKQLAEEAAPSVNFERPQIRGVARPGIRLSVTEGRWSGKPLAYAFTWEDCDAEGTGCSVIPGATNATYTVTANDEGHALVAVVAATTGAGTQLANSAPTVLVGESSAEYPLPEGSRPYAIAEGSDGNTWFANYGRSTIGKITPSGELTEYPLAAGSEPCSMTEGPDGNIWFTDYHPGHNYVAKITPAGTISEYEINDTQEKSCGIAAGPDGNVWFTNPLEDKLGKVTPEGTVTEYSVGGVVQNIVAGPDGDIWFAYRGSGASYVGKMSINGSVTTYSLPEGVEPGGITSSGRYLWVTEKNTSRIARVSTEGSVVEYSLPGESGPTGISEGPDGNLWFTDYASARIGELTQAGTIAAEFALPAGSEPKTIVSGPDGDLWFGEWGSEKIARMPLSGPGAGTSGEEETPQPGTTIEYDVPLSGSGLPNMTAAEVARWGQQDDPVEATAIVPPDSPQGWPTTSYARASIDYLDEGGRVVNVSNPSIAKYGSITTTEYNELNDVVRTLSADNRATALEAGSERSAEVSELLDTKSTYNGESAREREVLEPGTRLIETLGPQHEIRYKAGKEVKESLARDHERYYYDEGAPSEQTGEPYDLVTKTSDLAQLANEEEVEVRKTVTSYSGQASAAAPGGLGWKLREPTSVTTDVEGADETHTTLYDEQGQVVETRGPAGAAGESAHDIRTIYYGAQANTEGFAGCGDHPEWAGLTCETLPAKQPVSGPAPPLPVTETTYNVWDEPEAVTETFGQAKRVKKRTYDAGGRLIAGETTATGTTDRALPPVTDEYNPETGLLERQSTTAAGKTKTITSIYDALGKLVSYTDADGNTATFKYGGPENDGLLEEMRDSSDEGKTKQTYSYSPVTKLMTNLTDSAAGTFTATYDAEGKLVSEVYPNAMCANYGYNSIGEATHVEYIKTANCTETKAPAWFSETRVSSIHGEIMDRTSTLATENYAYDGLGRLIETQETPAGEGCMVRLYKYDEESNRTSSTTRKPAKKTNACATSGGTVEAHTYDEGNRLVDPGVEYEGLGNITKLPKADSEGEEVTSTYYVDNAMATQTEDKLTEEYLLDPEGRVRETIGSEKKGKSIKHDFVTHYDAPGSAVAWTSESASKWTREIAGIDGTLTAVQTNGATPILQLHDLEGNIVARAELSPEATKLLSTYNSTEFGVPNGGKTPPAYAWLGASGLASEGPTGIITEGATSYVPQTGRPLQSEQVEPPGVPNGSGGGGRYTFEEEPWNMQGAAREAEEAPGLEAGREEEAELAALRACEESESCDPAKTKYFDATEVAVYCGILDGIEIAEEPFKVIEMLTTTLGDVEKDLIYELIKEVTGLHSPVEWGEAIDADLNACLSVMISGYTGQNLTYVRCAITTPWADLFGLVEVPNLKKMPSASYCLYYSEHCGEYNSNDNVFWFPSGRGLRA
jgi:streptogramin lyase